MALRQLEINSKKIHLMKSITRANYNSKTVVTSSIWEYIDLWLRRKGGDRAKRALFYWQQANSFYKASELLPIESKPLTSYYCCLNAAKALLAINGNENINLDNIRHGISSVRNQLGKVTSLDKINVTFCHNGVLNELSKYLGEDHKEQDYIIYDLLYNIPCIHRAFAITYNATELFIPIKDVSFAWDNDTKEGWVQFLVGRRHASGQVKRYFPESFELISDDLSDNLHYRSKEIFLWDKHTNMKDRLKGLSNFQPKVRKELHYISGDTALWYLKKELHNSHIIPRNSITLIFAVMHWLSELVRYSPEYFSKLMKTKQNWLLQDFMDVALYHYIDEISCEMAGCNIMTTGYRK